VKDRLALGSTEWHYGDVSKIMDFPKNT